MPGTITTPPEWKPARREPTRLSRFGKVAWVIAISAPHADEVVSWWLARGGTVWSVTAPLLQNPVFWNWATWGIAGVAVAWALLGRGDLELIPPEVLKKRERRGVFAILSLLLAAVIDITPSPGLGLEVTTGRVTVQSIQDEGFGAVAVVLPDFRVLNTRQRSVDLSFIVEVESRADGGFARFRVRNNCNQVEGTPMPRWLGSMGFPGPFLATPMNVPAGSAEQGTLCLWISDTFEAPFAPSILLMIRDGVSQDTTSVEIDERGGTYQATLVPRGSKPPSSRVASAPQ